MAGKKFAAEFALRRNVSAQDKILIQDSDDDVVKYAYPPQIASLSGYAYAQSMADLPLLPSNKSIGYIVGQMLYIYVGMGGDTKDGLYQSVGFFVGPQGVQGEKGEKGERGEQGVQGPKGDNGGLSLQELDEYLASKQYVTGDTLADMLAGYVSNTSLMRDYVTIAKAQDVTGVKNFTAGVQFGGLPMYKSKDDTVYLDANLVVRGAVTMYGMNTTTSPSIFSALPIDGTTIGRNERGELYVIGGASGGGGGTGGGISIADVENYLTGNGYITSSALEPYALKSAIPTSLKNPNALSWSGYSSGSYDGSTAQSITIPNNTNQLTNGAGFITASASITGNAATATSAQYLYQSNIQESINYPRGADHAIKVVNCASTKQDGFFADYTTVLSVASPLSNFQFGMYANPFATWASHPRFRAMRNTDGTWTDWKELAFVEDLSAYLPLTGGTVNGSLHIGGSLYPTNIKYYGSGKVIWHNDENHYFIDCPNGVLTYQAYSGHSFLGGNVAIGGTSASEKLHVHGNILATGAITMYYSSDRRLKQNIRKVDASKTLLSLGGVWQYEYLDSEVAKNSTYEGSHFGLIYQNVKGSALDKMCHEREDGMGTLNYLDTNFISIIAGATMENISEVEKLKKANRELKKKVEQLEKRVA